MSKPTTDEHAQHYCFKQQPSALEVAYNSKVVRCFYCRSLLLITDEAGSAVCSANCPSKLVKLNDDELRLIRKAWKYKKQECRAWTN